MAKQERLYNVKPHRPVDFNHKAVAKLIEDRGAIVDAKYDGVRAFVIIQDQNEMFNASRIKPMVDIVSREGIRFPSLAYMIDGDKLAAEVKSLQDNLPFYTKGCIIDCEFMVKGVDFSTSSGIIRTKHLKDDKLAFHVGEDLRTKKSDKVAFNLDYSKIEARVLAVLPLSLLDSTDAPENSEFSILEWQRMQIFGELQARQTFGLDWKHVECDFITTMEDLETVYELRREQGLEGLVIHDPLSLYQRGKKSGSWKMKPSDTVDGQVIDLVWGTSGLSNEGKVVGFRVKLETGVIVDVTGLTKAQMDEFTNQVEFYSHDYYNGWYCEISFMEYTADGSLRHPSFVKWRGIEGDETIKS